MRLNELRLNIFCQRRVQTATVKQKLVCCGVNNKEIRTCVRVTVMNNTKLFKSFGINV
jgi:hypothetical protein